jgi:hyaluronoglucosaminidase
MHARATATAAQAVGGARWWTVGTDYAVAGPTPYLEAFAGSLPADVTLAWTGPQVVPLDITRHQAADLAHALGRKLLLWENFPVNDGPMSSVLHVGPYPARDPGLPDASAGVLLNLMPQAISNRIGVACGARFWHDPHADREATWREVVSSYPGLEPLARASRSWVGDPGPDPELVAASMEASADDRRLRDFLERGCRTGLDPELAAEVEPWLEAWDREAQAMLMCLDVLERGYRSGARGMAIGVLWTGARRQDKQVFGIRNAVYPVFQQEGKMTTMDARGVVVGDNLTDHLVRRALAVP